MSAVLQFETPPGKPVLRGQAHYWSVIRSLDEAHGSWSIHDVDQRSNAPERSTISDYVRRLVAAGIAEPTGEQRQVRRGAKRAYYRLLRRPRSAPRLNRDGSPARQGRGNQQVWNVLRGPEGRPGLTIDDIALRASTDEVVVKRHTAKSYIKHLASVGIVQQVRRGVWRLAPRHNTGPAAPRVLRTRLVYDPNKSQAKAPVTAEEDRP